MAALTFVTKVIFLLSLYWYTSHLISAKDSLHCNYHGNCICPESALTFICSASDGIATVWRGSIFNCPNSGNEIILRHSTFDHGIIRTCNDRAVVAFGTEVTNSSYTSQLNVTVSPEMHNGTIECIQDGFNVTFVGVCTLILAIGKHAISNNYRLLCIHTFTTL